MSNRPHPPKAVSEGPEPLKTLPGWSAKRLLFRGVALELVCFGATLVVVLESKLPGPWYYWGFSFLLIGLACLAVGLTLTFRGYAKAKREQLSGYTTSWRTAVGFPALYYLTADLTTIISAPHEPRPRTGRAADEREHLRARTSGT